MPRGIRCFAALVVGLTAAAVAPHHIVSAAIPPPPTSVNSWAWCGVNPDDASAATAVRNLAEAGGIDATFGPCNVPDPGYTPIDPKNRYVAPDVYMRLVNLNASVGMKTVVYDARIYSTNATTRATAIAFWQPVLSHIAAWDLGDEYNPNDTGPNGQWTVLKQRWNTVHTQVEPATGVKPFVNFLGNTTSLDKALTDLPGIEWLLSFDKYDGDKGVSLAHTYDSQVSTLMCAVNAIDQIESGLPATPATIRADSSALITAGCDQLLMFTGFPVYDDTLPKFGDASLVDRHGEATGRAPAAQEATGHSSFIPVGPLRFLETRSGVGLGTVDGQFNGIGQRPDDSVLELGIVGRSNMPSWARSVVLNVTVTNANAPGYLTVYPCGGSRPTSSNLNYDRGVTRAVGVISQIGSNGAVCIYTQSAVDVIVDVDGFYPFGASFSGIQPARLLETRSGPEFTTIDGQLVGIGQRPGGSTTEVKVTGRGGVPNDAKAVVVNITAVAPVGAGFLTVFPCGDQLPVASTLNFGPGAIVPNSAIVQVGANGSICVFSNVATDVVVDVNGYDSAGAVAQTFQPARILETRPGLFTADRLFETAAIRPPDSILQLQVGGRLGIPTAIKAAVLNITVTDATAPGFLTVFACDGGRPLASTLNYGLGTTVANMAIAPTTTNGQVCIYTQTSTNLVVDVSGYHT